MHLFCHISEFREGMDEGTASSPYSLIPLMMLSAESTTLWAPSPWQLNGAHRFDGKDLGWRDLLDMIRWAKGERDRPRLRVIAREPWLIDPKCASRRNAPHGEWFADFDGEIRTMYEEDFQKEAADRRVTKAPVAAGEEWAIDQVQRRTEAFGLAEDRYKQQTLPPGLMQKAGRCTESSDRDHTIRGEAAHIWSILKDARNHQDAVGLAGADFPVEPSIHSDVIEALCPREGDTLAKAPAASATVDGVRNALEIARAFSRDRGVSEWFELLNSKYAGQMRSELQALMMDPSGGKRLLEELRQGSEVPSLADVLRPENAWDAAKISIDFLLVTASLILERLHEGGAMGLWVGGGHLAWSVVGRGRFLQKYSVEPLHGKLTVFPHMLGYDKATATYRRNRELLTKVERVIEGKAS